MRSVNNIDQFTPFGLWMREYLRSSQQGLCVTNLDYVLEDFRNRRIMLVEEKQSGGYMHKGQLLTFNILDKVLATNAHKLGYDYWGFFELRMLPGKTMPGPGMMLNRHVITAEQLIAHLNFEQKFCNSYAMPWRSE